MRDWPLHQQLSKGDSAWCLRANHLCTHDGIRQLFSVISWLGNGPFWYAVIAVIAVIQAHSGLLVSLHLAATGILALTLYKQLKRWTRRPRPFARDVRIHAWVAPLDEFSFPPGTRCMPSHSPASRCITTRPWPGC